MPSTSFNRQARTWQPTPKQIARAAARIRKRWTLQHRWKVRASDLAIETDMADGFVWPESWSSSGDDEDGFDWEEEPENE